MQYYIAVNPLAIVFRTAILFVLSLAAGMLAEGWVHTRDLKCIPAILVGLFLAYLAILSFVKATRVIGALWTANFGKE